MEQENKIKAYKGFNSDMTCRHFKFKVGKEYEESGNIEVCKNGFHACENPMDVFEYYPPSNSRYCEVEQSGYINRDEDKNASSKIRIQCEIGLSGIIQAGVKFILDKANWERDIATNTGDYSTAANTGSCSVATNTGNCSVATNTGDQSAAKVEGKESIAIVTGIDSRACGALGCWIILTERSDWNGETYPIKEVKAVRVDGKTIKPNTWYKLENGQIIETE